MIVMVDSNEEATSPKTVEHLRKHFPNLEVMKLEFGDINVVLDNGSLLSLERKKVEDFLGSIADGRIFRQAERMSKAKFSAVICVGDMSFNQNDMVVVNGRETEWKGVSVRSAIYALQWSGCPVVWVDSTPSLPFAMYELVNFCEQPEKHMQRLGRKRIVTFPPIDPRVELLAAFPSIGPKLATNLLVFARDQFKEEAKARGDTDDKYSTIAEALMWGSALNLINQKARPEGWGNKVVQTFRLALGLDKNEYIDIKKDVR